MFSFSKLQSAMARLRFKDETALRDIGLAKLTKTYDAYPLIEEGGKLFVLLPRGMDPLEAKNMSNGIASQRVIVLSQQSAGLAKLWPNSDAATAVPAEKNAAPVKTEAAMDFEIVEE